MFEQSFVPDHADSRKPWVVGLSVTLQALGLSALLLVPLFFPGAIPIDLHLRQVLFMTKLATPPPPPEPVRRTPVHSAKPSPFQAPTTVPRSINTRPEEAPEIQGQIDSGFDSMPVLAASILPTLPVPATPPPPPPAPARIEPAPQPQLTVSEGVQSAKLIFSPKPPYPVTAKAAHIQGAVRLTALIGTDGRISRLGALSGSPLLIPAALDAVRQWRYQPTLLNGLPVEVTTEISVIFRLN